MLGRNFFQKLKNVVYILEQRRDRAGYFAALLLPTAWLPYDEWAEAKEMYTAAIIHLGNACIENGRTDLVQYC